MPLLGSDGIRHCSLKGMAWLWHKSRIKGKHGTWYAAGFFFCHRIQSTVDIFLQSSSFSISNPSTAQAPSTRHSSHLPSILEDFRPHESNQTAVTAAGQVPVDEVGSSAGTGPSQSPTREKIHPRMPSHQQALRDDSTEPPFHPDEGVLSGTPLQGSNKEKSEKVAAEKRRHQRNERELESQRAKVWVGDSLRAVPH
jgi:hypothetical protein